jgi:hypothetical protein
MNCHLKLSKLILLSISTVALALYSGMASAGNTITFTGNGQDQTQEVQALLEKDGSYMFEGTLKTGPITITGKHLTIDFAPGAVWQPAGKLDRLFTCNNCVLHLKNININGLGMAQQGIHMDGGSLIYDNARFDRLGMPTQQATDMVAGFLLNRVTSIKGGNFSASHLNAVGDGIFANNIGAARGMMLIGSGWYELNNVTVDWTDSDAEEADSFQTNIGNVGGVINKLTVIYNGNTRRCAKYQSGKNTINDAEIRKARDFTPANSMTDAGKKNFNCISWEANTPGSLDVMAGNIDASGFVRGIGNNTPGSSAAVRVHSGVTLIGSTKPVDRIDPQTGQPQHAETYGFYTGLNEDGSGVEGAKIIHFNVGAHIRCNHGFSRGVTYDDPTNRAIDVMADKPLQQPDISSNKIICRTPGHLKSPAIISVGKVMGGNVNNNQFIDKGSQRKGGSFIHFMDSETSASSDGNITPGGINPVSKDSLRVPVPQ